jgi:hypothetical protein
MPEDMYPEEGGMPQSQTAQPESEEYESGGSLLPKSLVGDVKPGDTVTLKVLHVYQDEVEVQKPAPEGGIQPPEGSADAELDSMAMKGGE